MSDATLRQAPAGQSNSTVLNWMCKHASQDWRKLGLTLTERSAHLVNPPEQRIKALETAQQTAQVARTFELAIKGRQKHQRFIHHSDRGIQYCSGDYQTIHAANGVACSMTDGYDCYQNALAECVNGILKQRFLIEMPNGLEQARKIIDESIETYNSLRPHLSLQYKTPNAVHLRCIGRLLLSTKIVKNQFINCQPS